MLKPVSGLIAAATAATLLTFAPASAQYASAYRGSHTMKEKQVARMSSHHKMRSHHRMRRMERHWMRRHWRTRCEWRHGRRHCWRAPVMWR